MQYNPSSRKKQDMDGIENTNSPESTRVQAPRIKENKSNEKKKTHPTIHTVTTCWKTNSKKSEQRVGAGT
jgi:hypothetical protein